MKEFYTREFYKTYKDDSLESAREVVPIVLKFIQPKSVIDIGCGIGTWLSVFQENGIKEVLGVDGDYVDRNMLLIPEDRFLRFDLTRSFCIDDHFDLVVSLEVAEHIPHINAEIFINSLTRLGPVVLFSAAIPFQGGTNHVNEQWPEYWIEHFQKEGYVVIDCIRKNIWGNSNVNYYYAQNMFLFVKQEYLENYPILKKEYQINTVSYYSMVHPSKWMEANDLGNKPLKDVFFALPIIVRNGLKRRLNKIIQK